jgi:hypothetical protein
MNPILTATVMFLAGLLAGYTLRALRVQLQIAASMGSAYRQSIGRTTVFGHARRAF